jgi:hypothetical protein
MLSPVDELPRVVAPAAEEEEDLREAVLPSGANAAASTVTSTTAA